MYIRKQPSGNSAADVSQHRRGRGEYEISGNLEADAGTLKPADLFDRELHLKYGELGYRRTGCRLKATHGKKRLRLDDPHRGMHPALQLEAVLLLPKSRRDEIGVAGGEPTIRADGYILRQIDFRNVRLEPGLALIEVDELHLDNGSQVVTLDFADRMAEIMRVQERIALLPDGLRLLLNEHQSLLHGVDAIGKDGLSLVQQIMDEVYRVAPDYNFNYQVGTDALPLLHELSGSQSSYEPLNIDFVAPDDYDIKLREGSKLRGNLAARGVESARFRHAVRAAYQSTCFICGFRSPASADCRVPGVDSAHILPWAKYDLDLVSNGICLCKLHHWAFDQGIMSIAVAGETYSTQVTERGKRSHPASTIEKLQMASGVINAARLPVDRRCWPDPRYLQIFNEAIDN